MIRIPVFEDRKVAVFGLGRSGNAAARALAASDATVCAWDDAPEPRKAAKADGIPLFDLYQEDWSEIDALVLSPGVPLTHPEPHQIVTLARDAGCPVMGDMELFARAGLENPVVLITGTNGKSTTTALLGHILKANGVECAVAGNIGEPVLKLEPLGKDGIYIFEISSFQIELTKSLVPRVAVLLNISPDHLDRHGEMQNYMRIKRRVFQWQESGDTAVIGVDDADTARIYMALQAQDVQRVIPVSSLRTVDGGAYMADGVLLDAFDELDKPVCDLKEVATLPGNHNHQNAVAAFAAARALGLSGETIGEAVASYPGLAHRQEFVATIGGVSFVNDSKATNPVSAARALGCYKAVYWIAGGRPKEGGIGGLAPFLDRVRKAYLIGEAEEAFASTLGDETPFERCGDLETAFAAAAQDAKSGAEKDAVVLLSPACASYDQFTDFEARGAAFCKLVAALEDGGAKRKKTRSKKRGAG